jgi:hypothetical protein
MTETTTRTIIPALPGWYVALYVIPVRATDPARFLLDPIVAWEITGREGPKDRHFASSGERIHATIAITLDGNAEKMHNIWATKTPDGKFNFVAECTCDNEAEALEYAKQLHDADKARVAAASGALSLPPRFARGRGPAARSETDE